MGENRVAVSAGHYQKAQGVAVSAGHYQKAQGARHAAVSEWYYTTEWARCLAEVLGNVSFLVPSGPLSGKIAFINELRPKVAVEIHFNDEPRRTAGGAETLYCPGSEKGKQLATLVQRRVGKVMSTDRGIKEGWYRMDPANGPDAFLEKTCCPAIIIEPAFIYHHYEIVYCRENCVTAIAAGIREYLDEAYPET